MITKPPTQRLATAHATRHNTCTIQAPHTHIRAGGYRCLYPPSQPTTLFPHPSQHARALAPPPPPHTPTRVPYCSGSEATSSAPDRWLTQQPRVRQPTLTVPRRTTRMLRHRSGAPPGQAACGCRAATAPRLQLQGAVPRTVRQTVRQAATSRTWITWD